VKHVIYFRRNIISVGFFESKGCTVTLIDNSLKVTKGSLIIEKGEKVGTLYLHTCNVDSFISLIYAIIGLGT
jgi:hypothetical protein